MKQQKDEEERAFPVVVPDPYVWHYEAGMLLRDYFAAKALTGIISHPNGQAGQWEDAAVDAYKAADAMIKARKNKR